MFWLDGHYSAGVTAIGECDTPVMDELRHIFQSEITGHVVIIDDARCFGNGSGYPSIEALKTFILSKKNDVDIYIEQDSIRITNL